MMNAGLVSNVPWRCGSGSGSLTTVDVRTEEQTADCNSYTRSATVQYTAVANRLSLKDCFAASDWKEPLLFGFCSSSKIARSS